MNYYAIVSGGTGSMCARALIFLFTAMKIGVGMGEKLYIRVVDMDHGSDAAKKCRDLMGYYRFLQRQTNKGGSGGLKLPEIVLENWNFYDTVVKRAQEEGIELGDNRILNLKNLFTYNKRISAHDALLLDTFFEDAEQNENLEQGFYGHPNIGSVVFNYVREDFLEHEENMFMRALYEDLEKADAGGQVPVYLYGSLFGGTGASVTPNLIDVLGSISDPKGNGSWRDRMRIGVTMLMPYFSLPYNRQEETEKKALMPDSAVFFHQTKEALQYYDAFGISQKVESFLLLGQKDLCHTSEIYARGERQWQHFHIVLLAAAVAGYRFLEKQLPEGVLLWKLTNSQKETLFASDLGLQNEEDKLQEFFRFSIVVSQYMKHRFNDSVGGENVYERLQKMPEVYATVQTIDPLKGKVPEKGRNILKSGFGHWSVELNESELDNHYREPVNGAADFCREFIRFYFDLALSGYDWTQYHERKEGEVTGNRRTDRLEAAALRMVDLLNITETDKVTEDLPLPQEVVDILKLNVYFNYASVSGEEKKAAFADLEAAALYKQEIEKRFEDGYKKNKKSQDFSEIYVACYEAAKRKK